MGHLLFCVLHIFAILLGFVFLFVTIPAHIIYSAVNKRKAGKFSNIWKSREEIRREEQEN